MAGSRTQQQQLIVTSQRFEIFGGIYDRFIRVFAFYLKMIVFTRP
jgi:hypothetical protein